MRNIEETRIWSSSVLTGFVRNSSAPPAEASSALRIEIVESRQEDDGHESPVALEHLRELVAIDVQHQDVA